MPCLTLTTLNSRTSNVSSVTSGAASRNLKKPSWSSSFATASKRNSSCQTGFETSLRKSQSNLCRAFLVSVCASVSSFTESASAATLSLPINGCTIYKSRLLSFFDACAEFSAVTARGGCMKVKGICPACITYPGDHVQMWLPDFLVEVSTHFGKSLFAEGVSGAGLKAHLEAATKWANSTSMQFEKFSDGGAFDTSHSMMWHVRILPVPYGKLATTFPPVSASKGVGVPVCYSSLSELDLGQWTYNLADGPAAIALAPIALPKCYTPLGAIATSIGQTVTSNAVAASGFDDSISTNPFPSSCALPIPTKFALAKTMAGSDTWNVSKMCIGSLGGLLPRTGNVPADNPYKAALVAGVKFASLTSDHFGDSNTGGWQLTDKWQLVYPPTTHGYCFRPGQVSQALEIPLGVLEDPTTRIADSASLSVKSGTYVFAVWRRRDACMEPLNAVSGGAGWQADYQINKAKNIALCSAAQVIP